MEAQLKGLYGCDQRRPLHSRMGFLYFAVPPVLRALARSILMRGRGSANGLAAEYLSRLPARVASPTTRVPLLLTHDVDTQEGMRKLPALLDLEARNGFASLSFLVTHRYSLADELMARAVAQGHRFAIHDTYHDNRIAYLSPEQVRNRIRQAKERLGSNGISAFRSPAFLRSKSLYEGLRGEIDFDFSASDWALAWPHPGDGLKTPFPVRLGKLVCIPTNLPRDGEMLALGMKPKQMRALVQSKATQLAAVGAPAIFLAHPDPGFTDTPERLEWYGSLLGWFRESGFFEIRGPDETLEAIRAASRDLATSQDRPIG